MTAAEHVPGQLDLDGVPVPPAAVAKPNPTRIAFDLELSVEIPAWDCWPDGEPEHWDPDTLAELVEQRTPSLRAFLDEWNLLDGFPGASLHLSDRDGRRAVVDLR